MATSEEGPSASTAAMPTTSEAPEPAAIWFQRVRELGDSADLRVMHFETASSEPRRFLLPHERFDGTRMMEHVLREVRGWTGTLPGGRQGRPPSFLKRVALVWRVIAGPKHSPMRWRRYEPSARGSNDLPLAYTLFDVEETRALAKRAEERGARTNSFLLWALDRAVYRELAEPAPSHVWALPVNMRGSVPPEIERLTNVTVAMPVSFAENASPSQVKSAMRDRLAANDHWGLWYTLRLLAWLGATRIRAAVTKFYARPRHASLGTMSSVALDEVRDAGWTVAVPPALRTNPVAAGAVSVGGRLGLALHVHPVVGPVDTDALMKRWRGYLEGTLAEVD